MTATAGAAVGSKLAYNVVGKLDAFYTGGSIRVSADGSLLACACADDIKIVETSTGRVVATLVGDSEPITSICWHPDGDSVFGASRSLVLRRWNVQSGELLKSIKAHQAPVADMSIDPTGSLLATASADRTVRVWDIDGSYCTHVFRGHSGVVMRVAFSPSTTDMLLASAGDDAEVRIWDLRSKCCAANLAGHFSAVTGLAWQADGRTLLSGGRDKTIFVWAAERAGGKWAKRKSFPVFEEIEGLVVVQAESGWPGAALSASGGVVCGVAGERGQLRFFDAGKGVCVWEGDRPAISGASSLITELLATDAGTIVVATGDQRVLVYQGAQNEQLELTREFVGNNGEVTDVCLLGDPASPTHVAVSVNGEDVRIFDLQNLSVVGTFRGHKDIVLALGGTMVPRDASLAGAAGGGPASLLCSAGKDASVRLWDCITGSCIAVGEGHVGSVGALAVSDVQRSSTSPVVVSGGTDKLVICWDLKAVVSGLKRPDAGGAAPSKLPVLATVAAHDKAINAISLSPTGALAASASQDRTVKVWQLPTLQPVMTLKGHKRGAWAVAFSPVEQVLCTGSGDRTIKLWSLKDGSCLKTLEGHTASVLKVCFLTRGTQLLSCGADGLVKLWELRSSECVGTFDDHEDKVWALSVGGTNERMVVTGSADSSVRIWEDHTQAQRANQVQVEEDLVLREQGLANALQAGKHQEAFQLAFELRQPGKLLHVVQDIMKLPPRKAERVLEHLAAGFDADALHDVLSYCRDWNTNSKFCHASQALLSAIFRTHPPPALSELNEASELLKGITTYTARHMARLDRLSRAAFLLDFVLKSGHNVLQDDALPDAEADQSPQGMKRPQPEDPAEKSLHSGRKRSKKRHAKRVK